MTVEFQLTNQSNWWGRHDSEFILHIATYKNYPGSGWIDDTSWFPRDLFYQNAPLSTKLKSELEWTQIDRSSGNHGSFTSSIVYDESKMEQIIKLFTDAGYAIAWKEPDLSKPDPITENYLSKIFK